MNILALSFWLPQLELIVRLIVASVCGYIIGFERNTHKKEAGIRTHIIVAIASCLMMEISKYGFADIGDFDGARLAAQVVSGIGFLGAGMIFVQKNSVKGLTTAAGRWATSGIGMAIGGGMYFIGIVTTLLIMLLQILFHKRISFLRHLTFETIIFHMKDCPEALSVAKRLLEENSLCASDISFYKKEGDFIRIEMQVSCSHGFDMLEFINHASQEEMVLAVYNS